MILNLTKSLFLILLTSSCLLKAQDLSFGVYKGDKDHGYQKLTLHADSTFEYEYRDPWASLMAGYSTGSWKIKDGKLILNTVYQLDEYKVEEKWLDSLEGSSYIEVENYQHEAIWDMKRIMINKDTTEIMGIGKDWTRANSPSFALFQKDSINHIVIFNGFFILFEHQVTTAKVNCIKITGNFSDQLWYKYFDEVEFIIKNNKLIGLEKFGTFKLE